MSNASLQINQGTQNNVNFDLNNGTYTQVTDIAAGSVQVNALPVLAINTLGTYLLPGTSAGTVNTSLIAAPGSGTCTYITSWGMIQSSGTGQTYLQYGTPNAGTNVIGLAPANGWGPAASGNPAVGGTQYANLPIYVTYIGTDAPKITVNLNYFQH
jgi:hypothetical protein